MKQVLLPLGLILLTGCAMAPKQELVDYHAHARALSGVTLCAELGHVTKAQSEELTQIIYGRLAEEYSYNAATMSSEFNTSLETLKVKLAKADATDLDFFSEVCQQIPAMLAYNREGNNAIKYPQFN